MHLDRYIAGQRLLRLKERALASAGRLARRQTSTAGYQLSPIVEPPAAATSEDDTMILDRRGSARRPVAGSELLVRRIGGFNFQVGLSDVSTGGCRIELIEEFSAGEDLIARFPRLEPLGAWVRWTQGTTAGVEFMRAIHPAVFNALLTRLAEGERTAA